MLDSQNRLSNYCFRHYSYIGKTQIISLIFFNLFSFKKSINASTCVKNYKIVSKSLEQSQKTTVLQYDLLAYKV